MEVANWNHAHKLLPLNISGKDICDRSKNTILGTSVEVFWPIRFVVLWTTSVNYIPMLFAKFLETSSDAAFGRERLGKFCAFSFDIFYNLFCHDFTVIIMRTRLEFPLQFDILLSKIRWVEQTLFFTPVRGV